MASQPQIRANLANARKSTGPRTGAGKKAVSLNAVKHGLLAQTLFLPGEDPDRLAKLLEGARERWQPVGEVEERLVEIVVFNMWRAERVMRVEDGLYGRKIYNSQMKQALRRGEGTVVSQAALDRVQADIDAGLYDDDAVTVGEDEEELARAEEARVSLNHEAIGMADAWIELWNGESLMRLARYDGEIARRLDRSLKTLETLQASRRGALETSQPA